MYRLLSVTGILVCAFMMAVCTADRSETDTASIIALENAALDRWDKGDVHGYLDLYADDITYFSPGTQKRADGIAVMRRLLEPIQGKTHIERREMIGPAVQRYGDTAILTYSLVDYVRSEAGDLEEKHWNSTAVYVRIKGQWKIVHSHWSHPKEGSEP